MDTERSSRETRSSRRVAVASCRSTRDSVRRSSMGLRTNLEVPTTRTERAAETLRAVRRRDVVMSGEGSVGLVRNSGYVMMGARSVVEETAEEEGVGAGSTDETAEGDEATDEEEGVGIGSEDEEVVVDEDDGTVVSSAWETG